MDLKKDISVREIISRICFADRKKLLIFLYIGSLIVNLLYFAYSKEPWLMGNPGEDFDSYFFINAGKMLFSDFAGFADKYGSMPYYWIYFVFMGLYLKIFGENFTGLVIIQGIIDAASVPILYLAAEKVTKDRRIHFLASMLYMFCFSTVRWTTLVGSDFLGAAFMPVCLYFLFSYLNDDNKKKDLIKLLISLVLYFLMRTNAIVFIICALIAVIWSMGKKARIIFGSAAGVVVAAVGALLLIPESEVIHSVRDNLWYFDMLYQNGAIVKNLYTYIYAADAEYGTFPFYWACAGVVFYRFFYYWTAIDVGVNNGRFYPRTTYAITHYLPNLYVFSSMFLGMIICKSRKDREAKNIGLISRIIWCCCIVQILCEINQNWRYRDIIMPMCFIVCAYGTIRFYDMLKKQDKTEDEKCSMNS